MFRIYATIIVPLTVLIPIAVGFYNYRYLNPALKIILGFVLFSGVVNLINVIMAGVYHLPTVWIFNFYTIFEFLFLSAYFAIFFGNTGKRVIYFLALISAICCLANALYIYKRIENVSYIRSVNTILTMIYSMLFFFKNNNEDDTESWISKSTNWITSGILIYYSSSLFMFLFFNFLLPSETKLYMFVWTIHDTLMMLEYILFAIGFYKCRSQATISLS